MTASKYVCPNSESDPLLLSDDQKLRFATTALDHTFSQSIIVSERNKALKELLNEFDALCDLNRADIVARRLEHFKIPNAKAEDFCERILQIDSQSKLLAGIRWVGGNPTRPFVSVWPDFAIQSRDDIDRLAALVNANFAVFAPREISLWIDAKAPGVEALRETGTVKRRYIVGRTQSIRESQRPERYNDVILVPPSDDYYDWYVRSYHEFHASQPDLKDWVPVNDKDEMEECRRSGHLFLVQVNGSQAGLIAAKPEPLLGMEGVYFTDIMMSRAYKGKGLAPAVQRKFIDRLPEDCEIVWGTIDAKNISSTKTAIKVGRRSIREELFVKL